MSTYVLGTIATQYRDGGEMQAPLARVVVGGLLGSTLVTLVIVPALYTSLEAFRERRRARTGAPAPATAE